MKLAVVNTKGKETGREVELPDSIFGIEPNEHAVYLDVKRYLASQRQGTHKSKERADIKGSTKKIKKQKGTGTARAGSIKSPIFRGGGRVFGPRPRNHGFKLNKNQKRLARKSALSQKAKDKAITIIEDFEMEAPKTKEFATILNDLGFADKKTIFVLGESNKNVYLSSRNLKHSGVVKYSSLNTYDIMNASNLVFFEGSLKAIETNLS